MSYLDKLRDFRDNMDSTYTDKHREYYEVNRENIRAAQKSYYDANQEKILVKKRAYREANREKTSERRRAAYAANRDERLKKRREYEDANREKIYERNRSWRQANPEKERAKSSRRRALQRQVPTARYTDGYVLAMTDSRCHLCGKSWEGIERGLKTWQVDHIIPIKHGGWDVPENVTLACAKCNQRKNATMPENAEVVAEQQFRWWLNDRFKEIYCGAA